MVDQLIDPSPTAAKALRARGLEEALDDITHFWVVLEAGQRLWSVRRGDVVSSEWWGGVRCWC